MSKFILNIAIISMGLLYYGCPCVNEQKALSGVEFHDGEAKYYLFGLTGGTPGSASVEVFYSEADKDSVGKNNIVRRWLSPPCLFGEHDVYYTYEYYFYGQGSCIKEREVIYRDIPGASGYLKVVNHSDEKVKMFISESKYYRRYRKAFNYDDSWYRIDNLDCSDKNRFYNAPSPFYKFAPISYLLYPDRAPNEIFNLGIEKGETTGSIRCKDWYVFSDTMGELKVPRPWTVEEVMSLYEAEYTKENSDAILHIEVEDQDIKFNEDFTKPIYDDNGDYIFTRYDTIGISSMYLSSTSFSGLYTGITTEKLTGYVSSPLRWYVEIAPHDSFVAQAGKFFINTFKVKPDAPREEQLNGVFFVSSN